MDPTEAQMLADLAARRAARAEACQAALDAMLAGHGCALEAFIELGATGLRVRSQLVGAVTPAVTQDIDRILAEHACVLEASYSASSVHGIRQQVRAVARS